MECSFFSLRSYLDYARGGCAGVGTMHLNCSKLLFLLQRRVLAAPAVAALCLMMYAPVAHPQDKADAQPAATADKMQSLLDELTEIDMSRSINPLKLTAGEIDKLVKAVSDAKIEYDRRIEELSAATLGKMSEEIHKHHKDGVAGGDPSKEFDAKVQKMMDDFAAKRELINKDNMLFMTGACGQILNKTQHGIAAQMEKDILFKLGKFNKSSTDDQYFNLYVVDVFISYPRIVPLLKQIKAAGAK